MCTYNINVIKLFFNHLCIPRKAVAKKPFIMSRYSVRSHVEGLVQQLEVGHVVGDVGLAGLVASTRLPSGSDWKFKQRQLERKLNFYLMLQNLSSNLV